MRGHAATRRGRRRSGRRRSRANSATPSASPRGRGSMPGGAQRRLGGRRREPAQPRQRRAQRLAALGERGVDHREHLARGWRSSPAARGGSRRPGRSRRWAPARRRCARPTPARRTSAYQAALTDGHAVDPAARARRPAGRRPRPAPSPAPRRSDGQQLEQVQQHRHRRRCRAGSRPARWAAGPGSGVEPQRVGGDDRRAGRRTPGACRRRSPGSCAGEHRVDLDGDHRLRPRAAAPRVSEPSPGPTSTTTSSARDARRRARCGAPCWGR